MRAFDLHGPRLAALAAKTVCLSATPGTQEWVQTGHIQITYHPGPQLSARPSEAKSTFHKTRPHPQVGSQPLIWKKSDLLVLSSSKSTSTAHLVSALAVFFHFQGLEGPRVYCCSATHARTLAPCRPVKLVPSRTSSAPMPADGRDSLVLKAAGPVLFDKGGLKAAFHIPTVLKSSLLYS